MQQGGAKMEYAFDQGRALAEWDERTWHVDPSITIDEADPDFPEDPRHLSVIADLTGVLILSIRDPVMMGYARSTADRHQAQKLVDFLAGWIREQRKLTKPNFRQRASAIFRRRTRGHEVPQ